MLQKQTKKENNKENLKRRRNRGKEEEEEEEGEDDILDEFTQNRTQQLREIIKEGPWNPCPQEQQVRELQSAYQQLLSTLREHRQEMIGNVHDHMLTDIVDKADLLYERVRRPADSVLDSKVLTVTADVGYLRLKNVPDLDDVFSMDNMIEWVQDKFSISTTNSTKYNDDNDDVISPDSPSNMVDWQALGAEVMSQPDIFRGVHVSLDMLDSLDLPRFNQPVEKVKKSRGTRTPSNNDESSSEEEAAVINPQILTRIDGDRETSEYVIEAYNILTNLNVPVPYFKFILDPESFARSIENLFYVSFLVKEDRARLFYKNGIKDDSNLMLQAICDDYDNDDNDCGAREGLQQNDDGKPPQINRRRNNNNHIIMTLTMRKWRQLCHDLNIERPLCQFLN